MRGTKVTASESGQTQDLASAAANAQAEGDDLTAVAATVTVRLTNRTQISAKKIVVSGTQQSMNPAGRSNELAYQLSLKSLEIKRKQTASNDAYCALAA